jgi:serine/threonine protein phosphatase PrpC
VASVTSLEYCELTDVGRRRANNQDSKAVLAPWSREQYRRRGWLFLVADGMGAHAAGETASAMASELVPLAYEKKASHSPPLALHESIEHANTEIHTRGESAADLRGMGTTCTVLALVPRGAIVGHVGDSRAYRVRGRTIEQLTRDHSLAWEMEAARVPGEDAGPAPPKNIITRSMGPHAHVAIDREGPFPVESGDVFVLCSDGLSGQVSDQEIGLLAGELPPAEAGAALLGLALLRGAPDNVTLIVARAGDKEASKTSLAHTPWPLSEPDAGDRVPQPLPWKMLAVAAASLLAGLIGNPWSGLVAQDGLLTALCGEPTARAVGFVACLGMAVVCLGALLTALMAFLVPAGGRVRVLPAGARLGAGPYRSYECTPSKALLEGLLSGMDAAAAALSSGDRQRMLARAESARQRIAIGDLVAALHDATGAIAVYRAWVEASRNDETVRGPANRG